MMIENQNKKDMKILRIEEGKRMKIGHTGNPLDGTWTRPSKLLKKQLMIQQISLSIIMIAIFMPMMALIIIIEPSAWKPMMLAFSPIFVITGIMIVMARILTDATVSKHRFRITDEELIIESGLLTTNRMMLPLIGVQQVNVIETYWGKKYGLKNVLVSTAGHTYVANANMAYGGSIIMGLKNANEVAEAILSRVKKAKAMARVES